jgi:hypothetical protein
MPSILELWLPILLSGVAVFFLSFLMHMVLPHHKSDWSPLPKEDETMSVLGDIPRGQYMFPHCPSPQAMKDEAWRKKYEDGPAGMVVILPRGPMSMGKALGVSLLFNIIISLFTAYVASMALPHIASSMLVFRVTSVVSFLGYAGALGWNVIWMGHAWTSTLKSAFDGAIYGIATGLIFVAFWGGA